MLFLGIAAILDKLVQQPPDILHDPNALALMGIGAGILGAIATIGATFYTVRQGRIKRRIEYQIVSDTPIVTIDSTVAGKVQILFNGQSAETTRVLVLKVRNAGNRSIHKEDYFEPLTFEFGTEIISADVLETEPTTLLKPEARKNFLTLGKQSVRLPTFPLNQLDTLTMTILLKNKGTVKVSGRLDQGKITELSPTRKTTLETLAIAASAALLAALLVALVIVGVVIVAALAASIGVVAAAVATVAAVVAAVAVTGVIVTGIVRSIKRQ